MGCSDINCDCFKNYTNRLGKRIGCQPSTTEESLRPYIDPCNEQNPYERQDCYRKQGYFQLSGDQPNGIDFCFDARVQTNDNMIMGTDTYFPYDNTIILPDNLKTQVPFRGEEHGAWASSSGGGYIKYDILRDRTVHVSLNTRQGNDPIAKVGIFLGASIDPHFQKNPLTKDRNKFQLEKQQGNDDTPFHKALDNQVLRILDPQNKINLQIDTQECFSFGQVRVVDPDYEKYDYFVYGLGPKSKGDTSDMSLNCLTINYGNGQGVRCNGAFGNTQVFGISASHWPVFYVQRFDKTSGEGSVFALFFDHYRKVEYNFSFLSGSGKIYISTREPEIRCFVITGKTLEDVRVEYMALIGPPSPITRKVMGLWLGGFGYRNTKMMEDTINKMLQNKFPLDGLYLDLYWYGATFPEDKQVSITSYADNMCYQEDVSMCVDINNYLNKTSQTTSIVKSDHVGLFEWDTQNFDLNKINSFYNDHGIGVTLIYEPFYNLNSSDMSDLYAKQLLATTPKTRFVQPDAVWKNWLGSIIIPDFTHPDSGEYWYQSRMKSRTTRGTFFWWNDLGEPEVYNQNATYLGLGPAIGEDIFPLTCYRQHPSVHNYVQFLWAKGVSMAYQKDTGKRFNVLARAGCPGISRYGVFNWTGDTNAAVQDMIAHTRNMGNLALSGQDFICSDAGGFNGSDDPAQQNQSQFVYSYWLANCCSVEITVKPHKWFNKTVVSCSPAEWGDVRSNLENIQWRYSLLPYYYSIAQSITRNGHRTGKHYAIPLFVRYPEKRLFEDSDAGLNYLVGDHLLTPLYRANLVDGGEQDFSKLKVADRTVKVPKKTNWYDLKKNEWIDLGNDPEDPKFILDGSKPLFQVFVRDLSILLLSQSSKIEGFTPVNAETIMDVPIDIHLFDKSGKLENIDPFILYTDDGVTTNSSETTMIQISVDPNKKVVVKYLQQGPKDIQLGDVYVNNKKPDIPLQILIQKTPVSPSPTTATPLRSKKKSGVGSGMIVLFVFLGILFLGILWYIIWKWVYAKGKRPKKN